MDGEHQQAPLNRRSRPERLKTERLEASGADVKITPDVRVLIASLAGGGAERVCLALCNGWVRAGLKVELLLAKAAGTYLPSLDPRVRLIDLKASRALTSFPPASRLLRGHPNVPVL